MLNNDVVSFEQQGPDFHKFTHAIPFRCISSVIRRSFLSFQNDPKNLDPSYKMDLDLWECFGRENSCYCKIS